MRHKFFNLIAVVNAPRKLRIFALCSVVLLGLYLVLGSIVSGTFGLDRSEIWQLALGGSLILTPAIYAAIRGLIAARTTKNGA